jgi:hypothetical protein
LNVAVEAPAGTVTLGGTVAIDNLLLESDTTRPPEGAAAVRLTVPSEERPPVTEDGFRVIDERVAAGGSTVNVVFRVTPL